MNKLLTNTTRFRSRCHNAFLLGIALALAFLCALFSPADAQNVQAMVKNQPFPYAQGVAMDTLVYRSVKTKLLAAEQLRVSSRKAVDSLQSEIRATRKAMDDQFRLGRYDARRADSLATKMNGLQAELATENRLADQAQQAIDEVLKELPRRVRKMLKTATPDQVAGATVDYIHTLQKRKWTWAGGSALVAFVLSLTTSFF